MCRKYKAFSSRAMRHVFSVTHALHASISYGQTGEATDGLVGIASISIASRHRGGLLRKAPPSAAFLDLSRAPEDWLARNQSTVTWPDR